MSSGTRFSQFSSTPGGVDTAANVVCLFNFLGQVSDFCSLGQVSGAENVSLRRVLLQLSSTFLNPGSCRGGAENVVWDAFSFNSLQLSSTFFNFLQPRVAWKMCSGTRFLQLWMAWKMWCSLTSVTLSFCASGSSLRYSLRCP